MDRITLFLWGCCFAFLFALCVYWHLKRHFSIFERLNIPGPKPSILVGNLCEIMKKGQFHATIEWSQKYGRVFGFFEGYTPVLSISDPDILCQVLGKDASNFMSRKPFPLAPRKSLGLFLENGHQWRRSRSLLTPAFSSGKLKQMMPIMTTSADMLVENLSSRCRGREGTVDMYNAFQSLSLDVIGRCAFGLQTRAQTDPHDEFLITIKSLFDVMSTTIILPLVMAVPFLSHFIFALKNMVVFFGMNPVVWLRLRLRDVIRIRKEMGPNNRVTDLVQLMLFPPAPRNQVGGMGGEDASHEDKLHAKMTEREVVAQSLTFLLAGYETTSAVLALLSHLLAHNPHVQTRLLEEIDSLPNKEVTYKTVQKMEYFDMVFDEACRLFPTASLIVTRKADKAREFKGFAIPGGMNIHANIWALHHDPEFWNRPDDFDPERFSRKNKDNVYPYSFLPFGSGPRCCIGMRFAILEAKIAMVRLLQHFTLTRDTGAQKTIDLQARGAIVPKDKVLVKVVRRDLGRYVSHSHG